MIGLRLKSRHKLERSKKRHNPDGAVAKSSVDGLVGTGFASLYQLLPSAGF